MVVSEHVTKSDVLTGLSFFPSIEQKTPAPFKVENSVTLWVIDMSWHKENYDLLSEAQPRRQPPNGYGQSMVS